MIDRIDAAENIDLESGLDQQEELRERDRAHDRQAIRQAVGLLDRTLWELHDLNFYAPSGRCWHFYAELWQMQLSCAFGTHAKFV